MGKTGKGCFELSQIGKRYLFIPFKMLNMQGKALTNARSVTAGVFTKEENAQNDCQTGNIGLALDVMVKWIEEIFRS